MKFPGATGLSSAAKLFLPVLFLYVSTSSAQVREQWQAAVDPVLSLEWEITSRGGQPRLSAAERIHPGRRVVVRLADPGFSAPEGLHLVAKSGLVATAILDLDRLPEVASSPGVLYIQPERRVKPLDDPGVVSVRAERVPAKLGLTGKGVILGVLDSGLDWTHPDFRSPDGGSRILALLDLSLPPDSLAPGDPGQPGPYGGIHYTREDIDQALAAGTDLRHRDFMGHGTHVTGTAAATASIAPDTLLGFGGVAPGADIVFVKISSTPRDSSFSDYNIMNGALFIDSLATALGLPCVYNFSFGENLGPHDGTGGIELFLASLVAGGKPGRAMVAAAGNERHLKAHAAGEFTQQMDSAWISLEVGRGQGSEDALIIEFWLSDNHPGAELLIQGPGPMLRKYGPFPDGFGKPGEALVTEDGLLVIYNAYGGPLQQNGNRLILIEIFDPATLGLTPEQASDGIRTGTWKFRLRAPSGRFDAYLANTSGLDAAFSGTYLSELGTISSPATHPDIIAVGAYTARSDFPSLDESVSFGSEVLGRRTSGQIASFSSLGPNRKGVLKPEITAPGQWVLASCSRWSDPRTEPLSIYRAFPSRPLLLIAPDSIHAVSQGTSFSAPHVAGLCALLLEADPTLSNSQVRDLLIRSATADSMTGGLPNNTWGYGRANAIGAARRLLLQDGDSLTLEAVVSPGDTVTADSATYSVWIDFTGSPQVLRTFRASITFPPGILLPEIVPEAAVRAAWSGNTSYDTTRLGEGILGVSGLRPNNTGAREELFRVRLRTLAREDNAFLRLDLLSLTGDLDPLELAGGVSLLQARPLTVRPAGVCTLAGDIDGNGRRDIFDLLAFLRVLGGSLAAGPCSDLDDNGRSDIFDLLALLCLL